MIKNTCFLSNILSLLLIFLTTSCGSDSYIYDNSPNLSASDTKWLLTGHVQDTKFLGGEVLALSASGNITTSSINENGDFNASLNGNEAYIVHFLPKQNNNFYSLTDDESSSAPVILRFEESPMSGALSSTIELADSQSESEELDLGEVIIEDSIATPENNPLEQMDSDNDEINDYLDSDDNGNDIPDEAEEAPVFEIGDIEGSLLYMVLEVEPKMQSLDAAQDTEIKIIFSSGVNSTTLNENTVNIRDIEGNIIASSLNLSDNGYELHILPSEILEQGMRYTVFISKELQNMDGETMIGDFTSWFEVANATEDDEFFVVCHKTGSSKQKSLKLPKKAVDAHLKHGDTQGSCDDEDMEAVLDKSASLFIKKANPKNSEDDVKTSTKVKVQFSKKLLESSVFDNDAFYVKKSDGQNVAGEIKLKDGRKAIEFKPDEDLLPDSKYEIHISKNIASEDGILLEKELTLYFSTKSDAKEDKDDDDDDELEDDDDDSKDNKGKKEKEDKEKSDDE